MTKKSDNICDNGHEKIAFASKKCPLCTMLDAVERAQDALNDAHTALGFFEVPAAPAQTVNSPAPAGVLVDIDAYRKAHPLKSSPNDAA